MYGPRKDTPYSQQHFATITSHSHKACFTKTYLTWQVVELPGSDGSDMERSEPQLQFTGLECGFWTGAALIS